MSTLAHIHNLMQSCHTFTGALLDVSAIFDDAASFSGVERGGVCGPIGLYGVRRKAFEVVSAIGDRGRLSEPTPSSFRKKYRAARTSYQHQRPPYHHHLNNSNMYEGFKAQAMDWHKLDTFRYRKSPQRGVVTDLRLRRMPPFRPRFCTPSSLVRP